MKIYKDIKKIVKCMSKVQRLAEKLENSDLDCDGIDWHTAELVSLTKGQIRVFEETEDYFVDQSQGYIEDNFYGHLYFKTDVPGQYVKVYFEC